MRSGSLVFGAIQFLMIAALFCLGAAFFGLHYIPGLRFKVAEWLFQPSSSFFILGMLTAALALALTVCFSAMQRHQFLRVELEGKTFSIDAAVIQTRIEQFWKEEFPEVSKPVEVYFARQKIEVIAQGDVEKLEEIEGRLAVLLENEFGYNKSFFVTLC